MNFLPATSQRQGALRFALRVSASVSSKERQAHQRPGTTSQQLLQTLLPGASPGAARETGRLLRCLGFFAPEIEETTTNGASASANECQCLQRDLINIGNTVTACVYIYIYI